MIDIFFLIFSFFFLFFPFLETITTDKRATVFVMWNKRNRDAWFYWSMPVSRDTFAIRLLVFDLQSFYEEKREDADVLFSNLITVIFFHDKPALVGSWVKKYSDYSWWFSQRQIVRGRVRFSGYARFVSYDNYTRLFLVFHIFYLIFISWIDIKLDINWI